MSVHAAVPTFQSFNANQFDTNGLLLNYRAVWTNDLGTIRPALTNAEVTLTNLNLYETFVLPAKVVLLTLGTNELNVATNSTWLLFSPTNDSSQVTLSLSSGKYQGQLLFITSQNGDGAFNLPDGSEQYDVPGALVDLQGNWVGTTNRGIVLQYTAPDWVEMARFNPAAPAPEGFTTGVGVTNISNVLSGNYTAGSNITLTTNANGAVSIAAAAGGATINPTDGYVPYRFNATTFSNSPFYRISSDRMGFGGSGTNFFLFASVSGNLAIGDGAMPNSPSSADNIGIGTLALNNATGSAARNVAMGPFAMDTITTGTRNVGLGRSALDDATTAEGNVAIGDTAGLGITDGQYNTFLGANTGTSSGSLFNATAIGSFAQVNNDKQMVFGNDVDTYLFGDAANAVSLEIADGGPVRVRFTPSTGSTGSAVANFIDVSNVLTNGDSLFQVRNTGSGNIRFNVDGNSGYTGAGTLFLTDNGKYNTNITINNTTNLSVNGRLTVNYITVTNGISGIKSYIQLIHPHRADGTGAVISTDSTQSYYGHALFSGTAATNANYIEYRLAVPEDLDTAVDLKVSRWKVRLSAADTAASTYTIGMASVADSGSTDSPTLGQYVTMTVAADASGASGDIETASNITLTGWRSNLTAGQLWVIRVARDGGDTSTVAHYDMGLVLEYSVSQ